MSATTVLLTLPSTQVLPLAEAAEILAILGRADAFAVNRTWEGVITRTKPGDLACIRPHIELLSVSDVAKIALED